MNNLKLKQRIICSRCQFYVGWSRKGWCFMFKEMRVDCKKYTSISDIEAERRTRMFDFVEAYQAIRGGDFDFAVEVYYEGYW